MKIEIEAPDGSMDYESLLMAGVIPSSIADGLERDACLENLRIFIDRIQDDWLRPENKSLLSCMKLFLEETGNGLLDESALMDILVHERAPAVMQVKYTEMFAAYSSINVPQAKFRYCLNQFLKKYEEEQFSSSLRDAWTIQTTGLKQGKELLQGVAAARSFMQKKMHEIESKSGLNRVPEGDTRIDIVDRLKAYYERKLSPALVHGTLSGLDVFDELTHGARFGDLIILLGYTTVGKTWLCLNWSYNACVMQGKNGVYFTAELTRPQLQDRLTVRIARNAKFGLPQGIDGNAFASGNLALNEEEGLKLAIEDFNNNPSYGRLEIIQIPRNATLQWVSSKIANLDNLWQDFGGVDYVIIDALKHLVPYGKGDQKRHFMNDMIKEAKQLALDFRNGRGVPIITPWHVNRSSWEKALEAGKYDLKSGEEADEIEKSADIVAWLLRPQNADNSHEITMGLEKNRSGVAGKIWSIYEDYQSGYVGTVAGVTTSTSSNISNSLTPNVNSVFDQRSENLY